MYQATYVGPQLINGRVDSDADQPRFVGGGNELRVIAGDGLGFIHAFSSAFCSERGGLGCRFTFGY